MMKKFLVSLFIVLLSMNVLNSLSIEKRRERVYAKERKLRKKEEEVKQEECECNTVVTSTRRRATPLLPLTQELVGVDKSSSLGQMTLTTGKVRFFSLVPVRLVRRPMAKFLVLLNIRLEIVDCTTNFDPRLCAMNCAKVGFEIDKRCMDCTDEKNKAEAYCIKQEKKKVCEKANTDINYVFKKEDQCCDYIFKDCYVIKSSKILEECCKDPKYKNEVAQCGCNYVLDHPLNYSKDKAKECCEHFKKLNGGVPDKRCTPNGPEVCTKDIEPCCKEAYNNPKEKTQLYQECCKKNPSIKECTCDFKMENQIFFPNKKNLKETCCKDEKFKDLVLCIDCENKFQPKPKCCEKYIADSNLDPAKTKQCCEANESYKEKDSCKPEKCTSENCHLDHCKNTDLCTCVELLKVEPRDMEDKDTKECFCKLNPKDDLCVDCAKDNSPLICCKPFLDNPKLDVKQYQLCCAKWPLQKNCQCKVIVDDPPTYPPEDCITCCTTQYQFPGCCPQVRNNLALFSKTQQEECCDPKLTNPLINKDDGKQNCCKVNPILPWCQTEERCALGVDINNKCCEFYKKHSTKFPTKLEECCFMKKLPEIDCCCDTVMITENVKKVGGITNNRVKECCKKEKFAKEEVCLKCNAIPVPDDNECCAKLIEQGKKDYENFTPCCLKDENKDLPNCKVDCSVNKEDPLCCKTYLESPKDHPEDYARCCSDSFFKNDPKCQCVNVLKNPKEFSKTVVCDDCYKKIPKTEKPSKEVSEMCEVCDCNTTPEDLCCKPKCTEVFKNPYIDLSRYDECCSKNPVKECQCDHIRKIVQTGEKKSTVMLKCCQVPTSFKELIWYTKLTCSSCPLNTECCKDYFENPEEYKKLHESKNTIEYEKFVLNCCQQNLKGSPQPPICPAPVCPEPEPKTDEKITYDDVRCCDNLKKDDPWNGNFKECCLNTNWEDKNGVCPCQSRPEVKDKYPRCCSEQYNNQFCCVKDDEYSSSYGKTCCNKEFKLNFCCGKIPDLLESKQKACCANSYEPKSCCKVNFKKEKCCNTDFKEGECCKKGANTSDANFQAKGCCENKYRSLNPERATKECVKPKPEVCKGFENIEPKVYPPCPFPSPNPCKDDENKCNCLYPNDPVKYDKCACLHNKGWSRKKCLCAIKPDHKDCECQHKQVQLKPENKEKCCKKKHLDKLFCDCQNFYEKYQGPMRIDMVEENDKGLYTTCCTKFFKLGFCYDEPQPPAKDLCPEILKTGSKEDKKYKACCAEHLELEEAKEVSDKKEPQTVKCCADFKCTFKAQPSCIIVPPNTCEKVRDIDDPESPKHDLCCLEEEYKNDFGCKKCQDVVFSDVNHKDHTECCKEQPLKCCPETIFKDPSQSDYALCCDQKENKDKCCKKGWQDINAPDHVACCLKNQKECCTQDIYWNTKHPDHKTCCKSSPDRCKPNVEPCNTKEAYDKKSEHRVKCCAKFPVPDWCDPPDCVKDVFPFKKEGSQFIECCAVFPERPECKLPEDCNATFLTGIKDAKWKECCKEWPIDCPDPYPECYPKTVYTDPNNEKHTVCCSVNPSHPACNLKCPPEVFLNVQNPSFESCCALEENKDKLECNKPVPCITECVEDNEIVEEFFNKEGFVTMKGRMKKKSKTHHLIQKYIDTNHKAQTIINHHKQ